MMLAKWEGEIPLPVTSVLPGKKLIGFTGFFQKNSLNMV